MVQFINQSTSISAYEFIESILSSLMLGYRINYKPKLLEEKHYEHSCCEHERFSFTYTQTFETTSTESENLIFILIVFHTREANGTNPSNPLKKAVQISNS